MASIFDEILNQPIPDSAGPSGGSIFDQMQNAPPDQPPIYAPPQEPPPAPPEPGIIEKLSQAAGIGAVTALNPILNILPQGKSLADRLTSNVFEPALSKTLPALGEAASTVSDFLSRGKYATAAVSKVLGEEAPKPLALALAQVTTPLVAAIALTRDNSKEKDALGALTDAFTAGKNELIHPSQRLAYADLIKETNPEFWNGSKPAQVAADVMGLVGDIAYDPTTYLSFGAGVGTKITTALGEGLTLSAKGEDVARAVVAAASELANPEDAIDTYKAVSASIGKAFKAGTFATEADALTSFGKAGYAKQAATAAAEYVLPTGEKVAASELVANKAIRFMGMEVLKYGPAVTKAADAMGVAKAVHAVMENDTIASMGRLFSRDATMPPIWLEARQRLVNDLRQSTTQLPKYAAEIMKKLDPQEQEQVSQIYLKINDETAKAIDGVKASQQAWDEASKNAFQQGIDPATSQLGPRPAFTSHMAGDIAANILKGSGLTATQKEVGARVTQGFAEFARLENEAKLLSHFSENYFYRLYDDANLGGVLAQRKGFFSKFLGPAEPRVYRTSEEAIAAGYEPSTNLALIYSVRAMQSNRARAAVALEDSAKSIFGAKSFRDLPNAIQADLRLIGDRNFSIFGTDGAVKQLGKMADLYNQSFRKIVFLSPSFPIRRLIELPTQAYVADGARGLKAWDGRNMIDARALYAYGKGMLREDSVAGQRIASMVKVDSLGRRYTADDLIKMMRRRGVFTDEFKSGQTLKETAQSLLDEQARKMAPAEEVGAVKGLGKFMSHTIGHYMDFTHELENTARSSVFLNALMQGHDEYQAAGQMNKALFDYLDGLSGFERQFMRRIMPFYSFPRFAVPLVAKTMVTAPGRVANLQKIAQSFFHVWNDIESGAELSPAQRAVLPGYLLEQPNTLAKFDAQGFANWRTFTSTMNFMDILGLMSVDRVGQMDLPRTLQKYGVAHLTPLLKVPFEFAMDKDMFTGQGISHRANPQAGRIGTTTPEAYLGDAAGVLAANFSHNGLIGLATKFGIDIAGKAVPQLSREIAQKTIGWEEVTDPRSGKKIVYVNPWVAHVVSSGIPMMARLIRNDRPELSPWEKAMNTIGISTVKLDLGKEYQSREYENRKAIDELRSEVYHAFQQGRPDLADEHQKELEDLLTRLGQWRQTVQSGSLYGQQ